MPQSTTCMLSFKQVKGAKDMSCHDEFGFLVRTPLKLTKHLSFKNPTNVHPKKRRNLFSSEVLEIIINLCKKVMISPGPQRSEMKEWL